MTFTHMLEHNKRRGRKGGMGVKLANSVARGLLQLPANIGGENCEVLHRKAAGKEVSYASSAGCKSSKDVDTCVDQKDVTISDLEAKICTLNGKISELELKIRTVQESRQNLEEDYKSKLNELMQKHNVVVAQLEGQNFKCSELQEQLCYSESQLKLLQKLFSDVELDLASQREQCEQHLKGNNELQSRIAVLHKEIECYVVDKGEVNNLKKINAVLKSELQWLTSEVQQLAEKAFSLETEECNLENTLVIGQDVIISLQSVLSSVTVRLKTEKLVFENVSKFQEYKSEVQQCKVVCDDMEGRLTGEQEEYRTASELLKAEILALQLEVQRLVSVHQEEIKNLKQNHEEEVYKLLRENASIVECKENSMKVHKEDTECKKIKLADQQSELLKLKKLYEIEVDHMKETHKKDLDKVMCENAAIIEKKEKVIKSLQENLALIETKIVDQQCELCALNITHEAEIDGIREIHNEEVKKMLHKHASIVASKEDVILSLEQSKANIETRLADKEHELDHVSRRYEKVARYVHEVNMDDVHKMLQERASIIESKECLVHALQENIMKVKAELAAKHCEFDTMKVCSEREIERVQAFYKEQYNKWWFENTTAIEAKESALQTLQANLRDVEAKLLCKERELDDLKISQVENRLSIIEMQDTVDTITVDCGATKSQLADISERLRCKEAECMKLEVSCRNAHQSMEAVKVRLLETEDYIERLVEENNILITEKLQLVKDIHSLQERLEREKMNIDNMEKEMKMEIDNVQSNLLAKLEEFRKTAEEREHALQMAIQNKQKVVDSLLGDTEDFRAKLELVNENIRALESQNNKQEEALVSKERKICKLAEELRAQEVLLTAAAEAKNTGETSKAQQKGVVEAMMKRERGAGEGVDLLCVEQEAVGSPGAVTQNVMLVADLEERLNRCMEELEAARLWEAHARELESLVGPFREQLESFELERNFLLQSQRATQGELRQMALQHAATLGHHNHQQKIKHLVQLKEHNLELRQVRSIFPYTYIQLALNFTVKESKEMEITSG
ncbi:hypothetical protein PR048_025603 [Dryococelus australis]|uniref:Hyaluronan-mediated motility receptor C-terminal domain-containing protein n=1 Tax=Dryococelus australis TaxID=614101 RepID=A0ABQ9GRT6_9NEOP|nr:hypothetical protein PR048_025603 [Dryococelus australis]